jgi:hypothetical protein
MTTEYTANFGLAMPDFRSGPWHDLVNGDFSKIDSLLFSALSGADVEPWLNSKVYTVGMEVVDASDASIWMCNVNNTSSPAPTTFIQERTNHPTYWIRLLTGFAPRGQWLNSTQYFPYDLVYDTHQGIMALCIVKHISTAVGTIRVDAANWAYLVDMGSADLSSAIGVTYSNTASGIPPTNVQGAIDYVQTEVVSLNNVNVTQGNQIGAIQSVNTTQDNRLTNLESKTSGIMTVPHIITTDGATIQFGGSATLGYYMDATNAAIRTTPSGNIYFQSQGGAVTFGYMNSSGLTITGAISASGAINSGGNVVAAGSVYANNGGMYCYGWGGNGNISVIFLNSAQNHYLYHDGTNITFQGCATVNAGNGRLWGSNDSLPVPAGTITGIRWVYSGDWGYNSNSQGIAESSPTGCAFTGFGLTYPTGNGTYNFRLRTLQVVINGSWANVGFAS